MKKENQYSGQLEPGNLAQRLREFRLQAGFSQQNVADVLNISRSTYTYYETGKTTPDPTTLYRIAKVFGVPIEEFFPEESSSGSQYAILSDSQHKRRVPKTVASDPKKVSELSSEEKLVIAMMRDMKLPAKAVISELKVIYRQLHSKL